MTGDIAQLWNTCLQTVESQLSKANFSTWFKQTSALKEEDGIVYISVPNEFVREWLMTKYHKVILKTIVDQADHIRAIEFVITRQTASAPVVTLPDKKTELPLQTEYINRDDNLNPRYVFDNFIVGPFNELAYAAAQAVVKRPASAYNPLFIYGASGLGKTHLIQAIGNELKKQFPDKKVLYTSLEKFSNDYVMGVQNNRQSAFREKYRKFDAVIIDDIQFLSGKNSTQNELTTLFNDLIAKTQKNP